MGLTNMISTIMNLAFDLLMNTCMYLIAISVVVGIISTLFSEFGFIALIDRILSKIMQPIYNLPGAASIGILSCYLSDNPAILTLADDDNFKALFKKYQLPSLTNLGTSYGMGLILTTTFAAMPIEGSAKAALIGNLGAIIGSIASVRMMQIFTKKTYGTVEFVGADGIKARPHGKRIVRDGSVGVRFFEALIDGGKSGLRMGVSIIPGVIGICSIVMILTNPSGPGGLYTGAAGEGVAFLPWLGDKLSFILNPLFGFTNPSSISIPITALGSAGAAMGMAGNLAAAGSINASDIAVFQAICMCWSGYLSTHVAMMDAIGAKELTSKAILSHTVGGVVAGVAAHLLYILIY